MEGIACAKAGLGRGAESGILQEVMQYGKCVSLSPHRSRSQEGIGYARDFSGEHSY